MKTETLPPMPSTTLEHLRPDQICDELLAPLEF